MPIVAKSKYPGTKLCLQYNIVISMQDKIITSYAHNGDLNGIKRAFKKGVSQDGFYNAIAQSAKMGYLNIIKFLLNNGENFYKEITIALKSSAPYAKCAHNSKLRSYLYSQLDMQTHFTLRKKYEVV